MYECTTVQHLVFKPYKPYVTIAIHTKRCVPMCRTLNGFSIFIAFLVESFFFSRNNSFIFGLVDSTEILTNAWYHMLNWTAAQAWRRINSIDITNNETHMKQNVDGLARLENVTRENKYRLLGIGNELFIFLFRFFFFFILFYSIFLLSISSHQHLVAMRMNEIIGRIIRKKMRRLNFYGHFECWMLKLVFGCCSFLCSTFIDNGKTQRKNSTHKHRMPNVERSIWYVSISW